MKILFVSPHFFPFIGGASTLILRMCIELKKKGHEITVFTSTKNSKDFKGIKVYSFPSIFTYSNTPFNFWKNKLSKVIEKEKPQIVVGSLSVPFIADSASRAAEKKEIPFFLVYHNDFLAKNFFEKLFFKFYSSFFLNKTLALTTKIISTSDYYSKKSSILNSLQKKVEVVSPFIDLNEFNLLEKFNKNFPEKKVVLFVGALNKGQNYKGLNYLIKAVSLLKEKIPLIKLVVVGKGNNLNYFKKLAVKENIQGNVFFAGEVSRQKLLSFYSECKTLVLPSVNNSEGFGLVLLEAMAFSKPVIGSNTGGIPAIVKHGFNGLLVEPKNEINLMESIELILTDKKKAKELGLNALNTAKSFSSEKGISKLIKLFEESLNEKKQ